MGVPCSAEVVLREAPRSTASDLSAATLTDAHDVHDMNADAHAARMTDSPEEADSRVELRPLDTLQSPTSESSEPTTDLDIVDDARFSNVPLSASSNTTPTRMTPVEESVDITSGLNDSRTRTENGDGGTTPSRNGAQFLLARLERSDTLPARSSLEIDRQKDFERVQNTEEAEQAQIDWGTSCIRCAHASTHVFQISGEKS